MGKAVAIPPDKEAEKKEMFKVNHDMTHCVSYIQIHIHISKVLFFTKKIQVNQFNLMASEMISLNRSLQDVRLSACKNKVTSGDLKPFEPPLQTFLIVSVFIFFPPI